MKPIRKMNSSQPARAARETIWKMPTGPARSGRSRFQILLPIVVTVCLVCVQHSRPASLIASSGPAGAYSAFGMIPMTPFWPASSFCGVTLMSIVLSPRTTVRSISWFAERWIELAMSSQPVTSRPSKALIRSPISSPALSAGMPIIMLPMIASFVGWGMPFAQIRPV